jgi:membrane associated rhomboid family serine protease
MGHTSIWYDFKQRVLHSDNTLYHLISINVFVFIAIGLLNVIFSIAQGAEASSVSIISWVYDYLALPPQLDQFILQPWSLVTYMFLHSYQHFFHIIFNMLILYWFGRIFQEFLGNRKLLVTYLLGGISGGILFLLASQLEFYQAFASTSGMVGASAGVLAVLVAAATLVPDYEIRLIFFGSVKIKYVALFLVLLDLLSLTGSNSGGHLAHIGGAIWGMVYVRQLQAGTDMGNWLDKLLLNIKEAFTPQEKSPLKARKGGSKKSSSYTYGGAKTATQSSQGRKSSTKQPKANSEVSQEEIDHILDKIAQSGYDSLSSREKEILFRASSGDQ